MVLPLTLAQLAVFAVAAGAMILSPGPDTVYVLGRGLVDRRRGLAAAAGTTTGILAHTLAVVAGLAVLLRASETAFEAIRLVGAGYLTLLGIRTIWNRRAGLAADEQRDESGRSYVGGVAVNTLNPQVLVFFLAFLPQFVEP